MKTNWRILASPAPGMILYRFGAKWVNRWYIIGACLVLLAVLLIPISAEWFPSHTRLAWGYVLLGVLVLGCVMVSVAAVISEFRPPRQVSGSRRNLPQKESEKA